MSVEMDENGERHDNPETDSHVFFKVDGRMKGHAMGTHVGSNEGHNQHSYFLRAKTPRLDRKLLSTNNETRSSASCEEEDLASCLVMLSNKSHAASSDHDKDKDKEEQDKGFKQVMEKGMFQCKGCKKIFNSHQALGGHRASHKKVKGCFAAKLDEDEENEEHDPVIPSGPDLTRPVSSMSNKKPNMHECSVCRRVFSSGQALGGHKRCHWLTTSSTDNTFITSFQDFQYDHHHHQNQQLFKNPNMSTFVNYARDDDEQDHQHAPLDLNLNLPLADQHHHGDNHGDASSSGFDASTRFYEQEQRITNTENDKGKKGCEVINKTRKLSDLRDVNYDGGWLQMGIASTGDIY